MGTIEDCELFLIVRDRSVGIIRQTHQAKAQGRYTWTILAQFVERDRFAGHIDARANARLGGVRSKDYQVAIRTFQKKTGVQIL
jgi:hypothetical protein